MIQLFSEATLNQLLVEVNKYKVEKRSWDNSLIKKIKKLISHYKLPRPLDGNYEDYLESILEWPRRNLFTYGTLMPGEVNHQMLEPLVGVWQKGYLKGDLYKLEWGMDYGLPAMKWDHRGQKIPGHLFVSKQMNWQMLDHFEGSQYQRIWVLVLAHGKVLAVANAYQGV